jgi:DedD protein
VIGLPRILDSNPKAVSNDIAVNILTSLPASTPDIPVAEDKVSAGKLVPKVPIIEKGMTGNNSALVADEKPETKIKSDTTTDTKAEIKSTNDPKIESKSSPSNKPNTLGLAAGEEVVTVSKSKPDDASKKIASSSKFIIQIGAFASEERAKGWITKLKDQKIPYSVSNKTNSEGTKLYVLRAGPFSDKELAETAEKKIKAMGLSPRLVEVGES